MDKLSRRGIVLSKVPEAGCTASRNMTSTRQFHRSFGVKLAHTQPRPLSPTLKNTVLRSSARTVIPRLPRHHESRPTMARKEATAKDRPLIPPLKSSRHELLRERLSVPSVGAYKEPALDLLLRIWRTRFVPDFTFRHRRVALSSVWVMNDNVLYDA